jgi:predicted permease
MFRSVLALRKVDPGFERPAEVLTLRLTIPDATAPTFEAAAAMHERVLRAVMEVPGVTMAGLSSSITMDGFNSMDPLFVEDFPLPENTPAPIRTYKWVSPGYFATMENRLVAGRDLTWDDVHQMRPVIIVTENFAREYWGSAAAAIGKRVRNAPGKMWREIVGVAADVRDNGVDRAAPGIAYWPMLMRDFWNDGTTSRRSMAYALRLDRPLTTALMGEVRRGVWSVGPDLPLYEVRTLDRILARSTARTSFTLVMLGIAAAVALVLGAVGLYGVISYIVAQRTREFGVRMALGARAGDVSRMVLREASLLVLLGLATGLLAAGALTRLIASLLFGVAPFDPLTFGAVALLLALVALLATWLPARRAAGVDPIQALRWE